MVSSLALGVPPTQPGSQSWQQTETNHRREKKTEGCCLNPAVKGSASVLIVRQTQ